MLTQEEHCRLSIGFLLLLFLPYLFYNIIHIIICVYCVGVGRGWRPGWWKEKKNEEQKKKKGVEDEANRHKHSVCHEHHVMSLHANRGQEGQKHGMIH